MFINISLLPFLATGTTESPALSAESEAPPAKKRGLIDGLIAFAVFFAIAAGFQFRSPLVADPDSLYHFAHAQIYGSRGIIDQSFPWTSASAIGQLQGDLWWGFHVIIVPFTWVGNSLIGLKLASASFLALGLLLIFLAARPLGRTWAYAAPLLVLFSGSIELDRLLALRPQVISMGLFTLAVMVVCQDRWKWALAVGLAIGYLHQTLSWLAVFLVALAAIVCWIEGKKLQFKAPLAAILGIVAAALLRPGAMDTLRLMKIQLVDLGQAKAAEIPMKFGREVYQLSTDQLGQNFALFAVLWGAALIHLVLRIRNGSIAPGFERRFVIAAALASLVGFEISIVSSLRGVEIWLAFGVIPLISSLASLAVFRERRALTVPAIAALGLVFGFLAVPRHIEGFRSAINVHRAKPAMDWVAQNSEPGDVVAHLYWDIFGDLLFNNKKNYYIEGMDPIFLYSRDPGLFWKMYYYEAGNAAEKTTASTPGTQAVWVDTHTFFSEDLDARFVLLVRGGTPELENFLRNDERFEVGFEDYAFVVFRIAG